MSTEPPPQPPLPLQEAVPAAPAPRKDKAPPPTQLPLARVHRIIKADRDVRMCTKEAIFLVARATEYMIDKMINQAYENARSQGKGRMIKYQNLAAVTARPEWFYLAEVIPPTVPLKDALDYRKKNGVGGAIEVTDEAHPSHPSTSGGGLGDIVPIKKARKKVVPQAVGPHPELAQARVAMDVDPAP